MSYLSNLLLTLCPIMSINAVFGTLEGISETASADEKATRLAINYDQNWCYYTHYGALFFGPEFPIFVRGLETYRLPEGKCESLTSLPDTPLFADAFLDYSTKYTIEVLFGFVHTAGLIQNMILTETKLMQLNSLFKHRMGVDRVVENLARIFSIPETYFWIHKSSFQEPYHFS